MEENSKFHEEELNEENSKKRQKHDSWTVGDEAEMDRDTLMAEEAGLSIPPTSS